METTLENTRHNSGVVPPGVSSQNSSDPESAQPPQEKSSLDELPSLRAYFQEDAADIEKLRCDQNWLRKKANAILKMKEGEPECLYKFAKGWLGEALLFGPAAKIFALALSKYGDGKDLFSNQIRQQGALATYKDEETPTRHRLENALAMLEAVPALAGTIGVARDAVIADEAETWALRGAVYRRISDLDGKAHYLHRALDCYRRSHDCDSSRDDQHFTGYGALNAAFLLDSLALHFESIGDGPILRNAVQAAREESATLRGQIIDRLGKRLATLKNPQEEWLCETIAGAYLALGLARWTTKPESDEAGEGIVSATILLDKAKIWSEKAVQEKRSDWKRETTHTQWLRVAYLNEPINVTRDVLEAYWNAAAAVINSFRTRCGGIALTGWEMAGNARRGKIGLALSGGGFRASFYHIGVLARLAEVDALRHVDVLSTVSGGSIVGAHYYLLLRELLEQKESPTRDDYIELVDKLQRQFCAGVKDNLRMRGLSNFWITLQLLLRSDYTRSNRMAELYDERLFARAVGGAAKRFPLSSLRITPKGEDNTFNPRFANWRRAARVPALLINATCLNTGHSWHFTANWMGEPPELIGDKIDKNERLRRVQYEKAPGYETLSLGFAVAASACVPGIFEPLRLPGLFPGRLVRLVDGGVHDNQGVDALLGQGCDFIFCSDGSGQIGDEMRPPNGPVGTPKRSMDILMKRVREAEHADIENRVMTGTRRGLFFVHLKSELPIDDVDWVQCDDPTPPQPRKPTSYHIDHQIQRCLSEIRTDLDSFSEVEAGALMTSGYLMTCQELERLNSLEGSRRDRCTWGGFDVRAQSERSRWRFLQLEDKMALPSDANDIVRADLFEQLRAGRDLFFKQIRLTPWLLGGLTLTILILVGSIIVVMSRNFDVVLHWLTSNEWRANYATIAGAVLAIILAVAVPPVRIWCFESFFAGFGALASNLYFSLGLNRMFLRRGKLDRLLNLK
jgi:predicted acylesterase/phospholipase RssA